ncbi:hypothetical protein SAV31267_012310 [Streptomyces avermitilis]|uniref:Uncharacterized protein n=1 Tax=Streptomyces avermitilis TaxID=33903 RepID=A0A4D4MIZ0_STRAX|nr:hypothetical protein SAV31267_012310 [Streptomyces avermitilis]
MRELVDLARGEGSGVEVDGRVPGKGFFAGGVRGGLLVRGVRGWGPLGGGGGGGGGLAEYGGGGAELMTRWTWGAGAGAGAGGSGEAVEERCTGRAMGGAAGLVVSGTARGVGVPAPVLAGAGVLPVAMSGGCGRCAGGSGFGRCAGGGGCTGFVGFIGFIGFIWLIGFIGFAVPVRCTGTAALSCRVAVVRCAGGTGAARRTVGRAAGAVAGVGCPPGGGTTGAPTAVERRTTGVVCAAGPGSRREVRLRARRSCLRRAAARRGPHRRPFPRARHCAAAVR